MDQPSNSISAGAVKVEFREGKWVVCVLDNDHVFEREFHLEAHAADFADDQRIRLGIYVP
jgi:hypothetical protein